MRSAIVDESDAAPSGPSRQSSVPEQAKRKRVDDSDKDTSAPEKRRPSVPDHQSGKSSEPPRDEEQHKESRATVLETVGLRQRHRSLSPAPADLLTNHRLT